MPPPADSNWADLPPALRIRREQETARPNLDGADLDRAFTDLEVLGSLGRGGMSEVWKARDRSGGDLRVIKVMAGRFLLNPVVAERFVREAKLLGQLDHPNIVELLEYREVKGHPCLVLEYVDGDDLFDVIRIAGAIPTTPAVAIAMRVCKALAHAHARDIVHRDVKPTNILVAGDGSVKLTDFGIAKGILERGEVTLTGSDQLVGTHGYMSPQQRESSRGVTAADDLYAVGIVLHEMLRGKRAQHDRDTRDPIIEPVDARLDPILARATAHERADRYPSAEAMLAALRPHGPRRGLWNRVVAAVRRVSSP